MFLDSFFSALGGAPAQSPLDVADNGMATDTSYTPPSWLTSMQDLAGSYFNSGGGKGVNTGVVGPVAAKPATVSGLASSKWPMILGIAALVIGVLGVGLMLLRKK